MSKERIEEWSVWALRLIVPALIGWMVVRQEALMGKVSDFDKAIAVMQGNRFTAADWNTASSLIENKLTALDKRTTRIEDAIIALKESYVPRRGSEPAQNK